MKIINSLLLPEYIYNAGKYINFPPNPKRMSATSLSGPPLIRTLLMEFWEDLQEDVKDKLWAFHGTALDAFVKKHSRWGLTNIKLEIKTIDGITLVMKPDYYNVLTNVLADIKDTSIWNLKELRKDYICQLNIYDYGLKKKVPQLQVDKLELHAIGRDWRRKELLRYDDYPKIPFVVFNVPRWSFEEQKQYIDTQLKDHLHNPTRECTPEEKWQSIKVKNLDGIEKTVYGAVYAVMKKNRKSALRVLGSEFEASQYISQNNLVDGFKKKIITIEKRPCKATRCEDGYCPVASVCPYKNKMG